MASATQYLSVMLKMKGVGSHFGADSEFIQSVHRSLSTLDTFPGPQAFLSSQRVSEILNEKATQRYGMLIDKFM
jgi:hypothetical protein